MQLICEVYHFMSEVLGMSAQEIGDVFADWNSGVLNSYLMEISAEILRTLDPVSSKPFVEVVLDKAGQKGTGLWTAVNSLQEGGAGSNYRSSGIRSRAKQSKVYSCQRCEDSKNARSATLRS